MPGRAEPGAAKPLRDAVTGVPQLRCSNHSVMKLVQVNRAALVPSPEMLPRHFRRSGRFACRDLEHPHFVSP